MDQQLVKKCLLNLIHEVQWSKHEHNLWILFKSSFQLRLQDFWSTAVFSQTNRKNKFQGSFSVNECCVMLRPILLFPEEFTIILVLFAPLSQRDQLYFLQS